MTIPSRHIHNVLKAYRRRLSRESTRLKDGPPDKNPVSVSWKRKAMVEKVIREMADRLTRFGIDIQEADQSKSLRQRDTDKYDESGKRGEMNLIFNIIDGHNEKKRREISSEDFSFLFNDPHHGDPTETKR